MKAFAGHFGNDPKDLKGTGIKGDDQDFAEVVRKDINGLSFNNLGFIYDVKTRRITDGLATIPLDLNENGIIDEDEKIYSTLDDVIDFRENASSKICKRKDQLYFQKEFGECECRHFSELGVYKRPEVSPRSRISHAGGQFAFRTKDDCRFII